MGVALWRGGELDGLDGMYGRGMMKDVVGYGLRDWMACGYSKDGLRLAWLGFGSGRIGEKERKKTMS